jgi:transcriptional regulator with XRE-family HTH domain
MSGHAKGPTGARRRLRTALRAARDSAEFTQERAAESLDWSLSKLIRIEAGSVGISTTDIRAMLQLYKVVDQGEINQFVSLARITRQRDWLAPFKDLLPSAYLAYIGLEREADQLRFFQQAVVPGILQTPEYGAAVIQATSLTEIPEERNEASDEVKQQRQENLLKGPDAPRIDVVLDEAVLHRVFGSRDILRDQLLHLVELSAAPHISLRVLPFTAGVSTIGGPFIILEFNDDADANAVYLESTLSSSQFFDQVEGIARYREAFDRLAEAALSPTASRKLLTRVAKERSAAP